MPTMGFVDTDQTLAWRYYSPGDPIPTDALLAGREADGRALYIGRGVHAGCWQVGKVGQHLKGLRVAYGGKEIQILDGYYILCGHPALAKWIDCPNNFKTLVPPPGLAWVRGGAEIDGKALYVARGNHLEGIGVGKIGTHLPGMSFPYGNKELHLPYFQVLAREVPLAAK